MFLPRKICRFLGLFAYFFIYLRILLDISQIFIILFTYKFILYF